jgi:hypothetical protein
VTRPERRVVEAGAGELAAVLVDVSMSGGRSDDITLIARMESPWAETRAGAFVVF